VDGRHGLSSGGATRRHEAPLRPGTSTGACYTRLVSANDFDSILRRTVLVILAILAFALVGSHLVAPDGAIWPEVDLGGPTPQLRVGLAATPWTEVARVLSPAVVVIEVYEEGRRGTGSPMSSGSGVVVRADGYVVTNAHVVDDAGDIEVLIENGDALPATLVGRDRSVDIAVLRVQSSTPLVAAALATPPRSRSGNGWWRSARRFS